MSVPSTYVMPVGDLRRPLIGRAAFGTLLASAIFFVFTATKQSSPVYVHAPWVNDPYDTVFSFTMFFVPLLAATVLVQVSLCRISEPLPTGRVVTILRACRIALAAMHYREGQDPVGALGLVVNAIVLWNTRYVHAATEPSMRQRLPRPKRRHATALAPRPRPHQPARTLPAQRFQPAQWPASTAARHHHSRRVTATRAVTGGSCSTAVSTAIGPSRGETADQLVAGAGSAPTCPSIESMSRW
jgi:hypothetical protein